uniref:Uncharacterized protein n=2 Tax=Setaria italica TaxID=4555 RepID=A0A0Q3VQB1_SETIT
HCHLLPPPPFVREPRYWHGGRNPPEIGSYAVVGGGTHVCISVDGVGTYCLDTASHTWSEVGEWTLPFHGRVEYVPELKLWFGLSAETRQMAALVGAWKELCLPEQWKECKDPQLVNLGSGRFCIARFFPTTTADGLGDGSSDVDGNGGDGKVELGVIPHKSRRVNGASIEALF